MKIWDLHGIFKKSKIYIESIDNTYDDYYNIKLKMPNDLKWEAGQHGVFILPIRQKNGQNWRAFSIASTSDEGYILIGTRITNKISDYKRYLINMQKGDALYLRGPYGWFKVQDDTSPIVLFAGGIGITPIRAILKSLQDSSGHDIQIIYTAKEYYMYKDEIVEIVQSNPSMTLHMINTRDDAQIKFIEMINKYQNNAYYFISGAPSTLKSLRKILKSNGISNKHIIDDSFTGLPI